MCGYNLNYMLYVKKNNIANFIMIYKLLSIIGLLDKALSKTVPCYPNNINILNYNFVIILYILSSYKDFA